MYVAVRPRSLWPCPSYSCHLNGTGRPTPFAFGQRDARWHHFPRSLADRGARERHAARPSAGAAAAAAASPRPDPGPDETRPDVWSGDPNCEQEGLPGGERENSARLAHYARYTYTKDPASCLPPWKFIAYVAKYGKTYALTCVCARLRILRPVRPYICTFKLAISFRAHKSVSTERSVFIRLSSTMKHSLNMTSTSF